MKLPLVLLTALFIASAHQALGETFLDWTYSVSDNQATITGYSGAGGAVDIPAVVNEISVVNVGGSYPPIFGEGNSTVTSVTIPDSVTSIGYSAFSYCYNLTSVTIPDSVTSIGDYAFYSCSSLSSVTIPFGVTSIEESAFSSCTKLTSFTVDAGNSNYSSVDGVLFNKLQTSLIFYPAGILDDSYTIPDSVTSIGGYAFYTCSNLTSITIPDSVTSIGRWAFDSCTNLTSITIPGGVTSIGQGAFFGCSSLISVTIPVGVTSIEDQTFRECTSLTSITVDTGNSNYSSVDGLLFNKLQTSLIYYPAGILDDSYTIPDSVTRIEGYAFNYCSNLTSITIPDSVTSIGNDAFDSCTSLTSATIPDSVTSIGRSLFTDCTSLTSVVIGNSVTTIGVETFVFCSALASVTIGNNVTSIEFNAFRDCTSLISITIPDSVTSIGPTAFVGCTSLTSVTLPATLFIEGNYSDYSLLAEQVRVERTSIDAFVVNAETAARASGARTIVNVSARVTLGSGQMVTPGFVVRDVPTKLLIRAVGPRLGDFGVNYLPNPRMKIFDGSQNVVRTIDDWRDDNPVSELSDLMTATASAGAFPLEQDTASAATLVTLDPGVYTVQVDSADEGVGDVLVEVYEISE